MLISTKTETFSTSQVERVKCQVVHRNERRIRVVVPRLAFDSAYAEALKDLVESVDYVTHVRINPAAKSIAVEYDYGVDKAKIAKAQQQVFEIIEQKTYVEIKELEVPALSQQDVDYWQRLGLPVTSLSVALLAGSLEVSMPFLVIAGLIASAAVPIFSRAIAGVVDEGKYNVDILDSLWITLHTLQGQYVAPALMVSLVEASEAVRDITARANQDQTLELLDSPDRFAWVERHGEEQQIPLTEVQKGDKVIVYPGDMIPVDGSILQGTGLIEEHNLIGVTPVKCLEGQQVYASTLVVQGKLSIVAERTGKDTRAALVSQFLQAPVTDTQVGNYVKEISDRLVVPTLFLSGSIFALTGNINGALAPLQLDFGTGIGIAVPTTILAALSSLARSGVFIRSGRALEALARTDTVVFGKTGVLTEAQATVVGIQTTDETISTNVVLTLAASAEQELYHPVARAIIRHAAENSVLVRECEAPEYQVGMGITTSIDGQKILVGSDRFLQREGIDLVPIYKQYPNLKTDTHSLVFVAKNGDLLGVILLDNPIRKESADVIATLKNQGIETHVVTGDHQQAVRSVATQLGINPNNVYDSALPENKIDIVRRLRNEGKIIAYLGEGLSDTESFADADVSISFAQRTDIESETADVVIVGDDLRQLIQAINIAKQAMDLIYQNIALVAVPNISVVIAGVFFGLNPLAAVLINNCAALIAELNGSRLPHQEI